MKKVIENLISQLDKNLPPIESSYLSLINKIDFKIDEDFVLFMREFNGAEGFLNNDSFILIWNIDDIIALNPYFLDVKACVSLFFFGSDGSNLGYAFDKKNGTVVAIDFLEIMEKEPEIVGENFESFLLKFANNRS